VKIILKNLFTFFNILCIAVAVFLMIVGAWTNLAFLVVVILNTSIAIVQEIRAKNVLDKLKIIDARWENIAVGDEIDLTANDQVPADCVITSDNPVRVSEALVTGESRAIEKQRGDKLIGGSFIVWGSVCANVVAVGEDCLVGELTNTAKQFRRPRSQILQSTRYIIRVIAVLIVLLGTALIARQWTLGILTREDTTDAIVHTAGAVVGMVPAGLFLLVTLALANSVLVLAKHKTLVRDMYAIEMLARVDTLCLDKTGTLTTGSLKVERIQSDLDPEDIKKIISSMMFELGDQNQTSKALVDYFGKASHMTARKVIPFTSDAKFSQVEFLNGSVYRLGATDMGGEWTAYGKRVLGLYKKTSLIALIVMQDTLRTGVRETVSFFKENGVAIKVISGDDEDTVKAIAASCGIEGEVYGRTSPQRKLEIIKELKSNGKIVAMTGDGVNDILALKEAHCSISFAAAQETVRSISGLVLLDDDFSSLPKVVSEGRRVVHNITRSSSLFLFKTLFSIFLSIFALGLLQAKYLFEPRNLYILEIFVIGLPSFALALERGSFAPIKGRFLANVLPSATLAAAIATVNIGLLYALSSPDDFLSLSIILVTVTGLLLLLRQIQPPSVYRWIVFSITVGIVLILTIFAPGIFELENLRSGHGILITLIALTWLLLRLPIRRLWNSIYRRHGREPK